MAVRRGPARRPIAAAAALALALVAGCAAAPRRDAGPPAPELSGSVAQYRSDIAARILTVRLRSAGDVRVDRVLLRPAGFDPAGPAGSGADLTAGRTTDVRAGYGPARCTGDDDTGSGPSTATVTVTGGGTTRAVEVTLDDPYDAVGDLRRAECAERAIRDAAVIGFDPAWTRDGDVLRGTLRLRRTAGAVPVSVDELGGTTVFDLRAGGPLPAVLAGGAASTTVPVEVRTARCDAHGLAESKRATAFVGYVRLDDGEPVRLTVAPADADRETLLRFATDSCGVG